MIHAEDIASLLLESVPSFADRWRELEHDPIHVDDEEGQDVRLYYLDASEFVVHLLQLQRLGRTEEVARAFEVIESLHVDGDDYVRELATIGYLEGIQNTASHATDVAAVDFETYLGPQSRRWWAGLDDFWTGKSPNVQPPDSRGHQMGPEPRRDPSGGHERAV